MPYTTLADEYGLIALGPDGSSAFITGDFSKKGLHDNLDGLAPEEVAADHEICQ